MLTKGIFAQIESPGWELAKKTFIGTLGIIRITVIRVNEKKYNVINGIIGITGIGVSEKTVKVIIEITGITGIGVSKQNLHRDHRDHQDLEFAKITQENDPQDHRDHRGRTFGPSRTFFEYYSTLFWSAYSGNVWLFVYCISRRHLWCLCFGLQNL